MSESQQTDVIATFRGRMRSYFLRVVLLLLALPVVLFGVTFLGRLLQLPENVVGGVAGMLALFGGVGGAYAIHYSTVRCPACDRWIVPVGMNGFAPRACANCKVALR